MSFFPSRNLKYNQEIPLPAGLIHGQSLGAVSGMKFGLSTVSYSGCEVIAVYNALLLKGRHLPFPEIARYMERFRMLGGFWGTNFWALGRCLRHFGLASMRVWRRAKLTQALDEGNICIAVYWTKRRFASSVHTVCIRLRPDGHLSICNAYNNCGHMVEMPLSDFLKKKLIMSYIVQNPEEMPENERASDDEALHP